MDVTDLKSLAAEVRKRMETAIEHVRRELAGLRGGRASIALLDPVQVEAYGGMMPLNQVASLSIPEPTVIVAQPFDPSIIGEISKAIQSSDVGLAPNSDGRVIRLNVPPLSTERRKQLVARVKDLAEDARVSIRNIRRDANKHADQLLKDKILSEDLHAGLKDDIQELTKTYEGKVNSQAEAKEKDVMEQ